MKIFLLLAVLLSCVSLPSSAQSTSPAVATAQQQIEVNNEAVAHAIRTQDYAALEQLWSLHMIVNSPGNSILTRAEVIAAMHHGGLNYSSLKTTTEAFTLFGDIAVEMGHEDFVMAAGPAAGKPLERRYTDIWQRSGDHWLQIARQATILNADADWVYGHPSPAPKAQSH